ncbi:hypothetical protein HYH02_014901 [Chlamydomonas schloesseri]|uniref:SPX domain-containing protein n=1 Tax=Chlamydomonas schloesseri TaxID=2026947 RepID=A0A835SSK8_9CHLO|nr:hypothetical protein HYH02_014901 [Chlamydomonas schloesseri]|eukprot:KAG2425900.1 hypothetical protein HYH02_014901 [Chlamydomonas schloesseri]
MKFGKVLKVSSENMPGEMHDLFLRYKELKKKIKAIPVSKDPAAGEKQASVSPDGSATAGSGGSSGAAITATVLSPEEQAFINTLNEDLARFNRFFIEKEEEAVIRLQALCDELAPAAKAAGVHIPEALTSTVDTEHDEPLGGTTAHRPPQKLQQQQRHGAERSAGSSPEVEAQAQAPASSSHAHGPAHGHGQGQAAAAGASPAAALQAVKSRLVQFHGEMVLLLHWSLLNYAAVVKILKKHDKRTGVLLRAPYLANVLQQPFSSTAIMSKLAKRAEELVVATTRATPLHAAAATAVAAANAAGAAAPPVRAAAAATAEASAGGQETHVTTTTTTTTAAATVAAPAGGRRAPEAAGGTAAPGVSTASASEASTLTFAAGEPATGRAPAGAHGEAPEAPLVGSTMHALETWANLRKNAITPSTVVAAEDLGKRKAGEMEEDAGAAAGAPAAKVGRKDE